MNKTEKMVSTVKRACACVLGVFAFTAGAATVTEVKTVTHYPWSGNVDVTYTVQGVEPGSAYALQAVVSAGGKEYTNDKWNRVITADGTYTNAFTWDAGSVTNVNWRDVNAQVRITLDEPEYTVVKLTDEDPAEPKWSVSYRCAKEVDLDDDTYRTDRLLLKRVVVSRAGKKYVNHFGVFEVTQGQYKHVMGEGVNPSYFTENEDRLVEDMRPVECISYEALKTQQGNFFEVLNTKTGLKLDLPQVVDWEAAAYGNMPTDKNGNRIADYNVNADPTATPYHTLKNTTADFEWLPNMGRYVDLWKGTVRTKNGNANANRYSDASRGTAIVGTYAPNDLGLYDMHGNVSEWTLNTDGEDQHILCGGNWQSAAEKCAIGEASRWWYKDADKSQLYKAGFRVFGNAAAVPFPTVSEKSAGFIVDCAVGNVRKVDVRAVGTKYEYTYLDRDGKPYGVAWSDFVAEWDPAWTGDRNWVPTKAGENKVQFNDKDLWATFVANMPEGGAAIVVDESSRYYTFDGFPHKISISTSIAGAEFEYSTNGVDWAATNPEFVNVKRFQNAPAGDVQEYPVYYRIVKPFAEDVSGQTTLKISPLDLVNATISFTDDVLVYNGKQQKRGIKSVSISNEQGTKTWENLVESVDYRIKAGTDIGTDAGPYTLTLVGQRNFKGTVSKDWEILAKSFGELGTIVTDSPLTYNGNVQECKVLSVTTADGNLIPAGNYDVSGNKQTEAGTYTLTVTAKGNYTGAKAVAWAINKKSIAGAVLSPADVFYYDGTEKTMNVKQAVVDGLVIPVKDLTLAGNTGTNRGTYQLIATADNSQNFFGSATMNWEIKPRTVTKDMVKIVEGSYDEVFNREEKKPAVTFTDVPQAKISAADFLPDYKYENNVNAGKMASVTVYASDSGNYTGSMTVYFEIKPATLSAMTLNEPTSFDYDRDPHSVTIASVKAKDGEVTLADNEYSYDASELTKTDAGTYTVTVTAKDPNFTGSASAKWSIGTRDIADAEIKQVNVPTYTGDDFEPEFEVTYKGAALEKGTDYTATYTATNAAGAYTATIAGKLNYSGSKDVDWTITPRNLDETSIEVVPVTREFTYNGEKQVPVFTVTYHGGEKLLTLEKDKDYTVEEPQDAVNSNDEEEKTVKIIAVEGGNYAKETSFTYVIKRLSIAQGKQNDIYFEYNGKEQTAVPEVKVAVQTEQGPKDLVATAANGGLEPGCRSGTLTATEKANYTALVAGAGNFTDTLTINWSIGEKSFNPTWVTLEYESTTYTGEALKPTVTVTDPDVGVLPTDEFKVTYDDNVNAGRGRVTVEAIKNYKGTVEKQFTINPKNVAELDNVKQAKKLIYNAKEQTCKINATYNGMYLTEGTDYTLLNQTQTEAKSDYKLTMTGTGNYTGSREVTWAIEPRTIEGATITMDEKTYNGKDQDATGTITVTTAGGNVITLTVNKDYTFSGATPQKDVNDSYSVTAIGKGNFKGEKSATWKMNRKDIDGATITFRDGDKNSFVYDNKPHSVTIASVRVADIAEDVTYTAEGLGPQTAKGEYTAQVTGTGNYKGTASRKWYITGLDLAGAVVTFGNNEQVHTGNEITATIESVKIGDVEVKDDCQWTESELKAVQPGHHAVTITPKTENVTGSCTTNWIIRPQAPRFSPPGTNVLEEYTVFVDPEQAITFSQDRAWKYSKPTIMWSTNDSEFVAYANKRIVINTLSGDCKTKVQAYNVVDGVAGPTNTTTYVRGIGQDVEIKLDEGTVDPYGTVVNGTNYYNSTSYIVINRLKTIGGKATQYDPMAKKDVSVFPAGYDYEDGQIWYTLTVDGEEVCTNKTYDAAQKIPVRGLEMKLSAYVKGSKYQSGAVTNMVFTRAVKQLAAPVITVVTNDYLAKKSNPALGDRTITMTVPGVEPKDQERLVIYYTTTQSVGSVAEAVDPMGPEQFKDIVGEKYIPGTTPDLQFNLDLYGNFQIKAVAYLDYVGDKDYYGKSAITNAATSREWTINDALDAPGIEFTTGSNDTAWVHQKAGYDNYPVYVREELLEDELTDCMRSGKISIPQELEGVEGFTNSSILATLHGPGCLKFKWMASCDNAEDYGVSPCLFHHGEFLVDGVITQKIDAISGWTDVEFEVLGAGDHTITWRYVKDYFDYDGADDCIWLDQVKWTPSPLLNAENATIDIQSLTYTATNMWPAVTITCLTTNAPHVAQGDVLVEGEDYSLKFFDAAGNDVTATGIKAAGEGYKVVAIGCEAKWSGEWTNAWSIAKRTISNENTTIVLTPGEYGFNNKYHNVTNDKVVVTVQDVTGDLTPGEYVSVDGYKARNVGTYTYKIKGDEKNFTGIATQTWTITGLPIETAEVTLEQNEFTYDGDEKTAKVSKVVVNGIDITALTPEVWAVDESTNKRTDAGDYALVITGCVNCTGRATANWKIAKRKMAEVYVVQDTTPLTYTGAVQKRTLTKVSYNGHELAQDEYTVTYDENNEPKSAGEHTITLTAAEKNFTGATTRKYTIAPRPIGDVALTFDPASCSFTYDASGHRLAVASAVYNGMPLAAGTDYNLSCEEKTDVGNYQATISGIGNYTGGKTVDWSITKCDFSTMPYQNFVLEQYYYDYDGKEHKPAVTRVICNGKTVDKNEYEVSYEDDTTSAGTHKVTVKATEKNFTGEKKPSYVIRAYDFSTNLTVRLGDAPVYTAGDQPLTQTVVEVTCAGIEDPLVEGTDYTVVSNNVYKDAGWFYLTIAATPDGNYTGATNVLYQIMPADISGATVSLEDESYVYDGTQKTPVATLTFNGKEIASNACIAATSEEIAGWAESGDVSATNAKDPYTIVLTGKYDAKKAAAEFPNVVYTGNFSNKLEKTWAITPRGITNATVNAVFTENKMNVVYFNGAKQHPVTVTVTDAVAITDGDWSWEITDPANKDMQNGGVKTITVTGTNNYEGVTNVTVEILKQQMCYVTVDPAEVDLVWNGTLQTRGITNVTYNGYTLIPGIDYVEPVAGQTATDAGKYQMHLRAADSSTNFVFVKSNPENTDKVVDWAIKPCKPTFQISTRDTATGVETTRTLGPDEDVVVYYSTEVKYGRVVVTLSVPEEVRKLKNGWTLYYKIDGGETKQYDPSGMEAGAKFVIENNKAVVEAWAVTDDGVEGKHRTVKFFCDQLVAPSIYLTADLDNPAAKTKGAISAAVDVVDQPLTNFFHKTQTVVLTPFAMMEKPEIDAATNGLHKSAYDWTANDARYWIYVDGAEVVSSNKYEGAFNIGEYADGKSATNILVVAKVFSGTKDQDSAWTSNVFQRLRGKFVEPTMELTGGSFDGNTFYHEGQPVTIAFTNAMPTCSNATHTTCGTIRYTLDGGATTNTLESGKAFLITNTTTVVAWVEEEDHDPSDKVTKTFVRAMEKLAPIAMTLVLDGETVDEFVHTGTAMAFTNDLAQIAERTAVAWPTNTTVSPASPFTLTNDAGVVTVVASCADYLPVTNTFRYGRKLEPVATPVVTLTEVAGDKGSVNVEIACATEGAKIYYTVDGSVPVGPGEYGAAVNGKPYAGVCTEPLPLYSATTTMVVKAIAYTSCVEHVDCFVGRSAIGQGSFLRHWDIGDVLGDPNQKFYMGDKRIGLVLRDGTVLTEADTNAIWRATTNVYHAGVASMRSGKIGNNEKSTLTTVVEGPGAMTFWWKTSCEEDPVYHDFDHVEVRIDGVEFARKDGTNGWDHATNGWELVNMPIVDAGRHVIDWIYVKDGTESYGYCPYIQDCAWIADFNWQPCLNITNATVVLGPTNVFNFTEQTQKIEKVSIMVTNKVGVASEFVLVPGTDYTVSNNWATDVGSYEMTLTATETNFTGSVKVPFVILPKDVGEGLVIDLDPTKLYYNGYEQTQQVTRVTWNGFPLTRDVHYRLTGDTATLAGTNTLVFTGLAESFSGMTNINWVIHKCDIGGSTISFTESPLTYNDKTQTIEVASVVIAGVKDPLVYGTDYTIDAGTDQAKDVGSYAMKITAMGNNFTGTGTAGWMMEPLSITNATVKYEQSAFTYDGTEHIAVIKSLTAVHPDGYAVTMTNAATGWRIDNTKPNRTDRATDAGWYYAHVEGFANLTNEVNYKKCLWKINPRTLTGEMVSVDPTSYEPVYSRSAKEPKLVFADKEPAKIDVAKDIETPYTYDKNVNAGTGTVTVVAQGNYTGTVVKEFEILKAGFKTVELNTYEQTFTGGELSVSVTKVTTTNEVVGGVKKLEYTERGLTATNVGTYAVVVKPTSPNFTASATTNWVIKPAGIAEGLVVEWATNLTYNAAEQTNAVKSVTWKGIELKPGVDYVVSNNWGTAAGTNEACFAGKGNYSGTTNVAWSIEKLDMGYTNPGKVEFVPGPWSLDFTYDGYPKTVEIAEVRVQHPDGYMVTNTFAMGNYELSRDVTRTNAGSYSVTVTGVGNLKGYRGSGWTIKAAALTNEMVTLSATNFVYNAEGQSPVVTVTAAAPAEIVAGDDYDVTFLSAGDYTTDITNAGTKVAIVTAKRNWKGAVTNEYVIGKAVIGTLVLNEPTTFDYDGAEKKVTVASVTTTNEVPVTAEDYDFTGNLGTNAATYVATVTAKAGSRNFTGSASTNWVVNPRSLDNVTITYEDLTYNREIQTPVSNVTDTVTITESDFTTSVEPAEVKNAGDYTVTVVGTNNYAGTRTVTFKVKPAVIMSFEFNGASKIEYCGKEITVDARNVKTDNGLVLEKTEWAFEDSGTTTYHATDVGNYTAAIKSLDAANIVVKAGGVAKPWSIYAKDISGAEVVVNLEKDVVYAAKPQTIKDGNVLSVTADGVEVKNYTISCDEQKNAGKHTAKVTANDPNFKGTADVEWEIMPRDITGGTVAYVEDPVCWTGSDVQVKMATLTVDGLTFQASDTTFTYAGDKKTEAGLYENTFQATGSDNFKGQTVASWRIKPTKPTIKPGEGGKYSEILPYITVEMMKDDEDWTIEYAIDGGAWTTYTGKFDITKRCIVKARNVSKDGKVTSDIATMEYSFGDNINPTVALYAATQDDVPTDAEMKGAGQLIWDPATDGPYTNFYHQNMQINLTRFGTMTAAEIGKAIAETTYKVGGKPVCPYTDGDVWYTVDFAGNGLAPTNVPGFGSVKFVTGDKTTWPTISSNATVVAQVFGKTLADGNPVTNVFNRIRTQVPDPVITPASQTFNHTVDVTIVKGVYTGKEKSVTENTVLYYAINGEVTSSSTKYTGSFKVTRNDADADGKVVVRALAYIDEDHISGTNEVTYTFVEQKLIAPAISLSDVTGEEEVGKKGPNTFTHMAPQVDITHPDAPDGAKGVGKVYYTVDGSDPRDPSSARWEYEAFQLDSGMMSNEQVTVMAFVDAAGTDYGSSDVTTNTFTWCKYAMEKPVILGNDVPVTTDQTFYTDGYTVTIMHPSVNTTGDPDDDHVLHGRIYWSKGGETNSFSYKAGYRVDVEISGTTTFWVMHEGDNQHSNTHVSLTFTRKIPAPKVYLTDLAGNKLYEDDGTTPATNFYHNAKLVMETSTEDATIGYESDELGTGTYAAPIDVGSTFTVSAKVTKSPYTSDATTVTFTRKWETLGAPTVALKNPEGVMTNVFRHSGDTVLVTNLFDYVKHDAEKWPTNATIKIAFGDESAPTGEWFDYVEDATILTTNEVTVWAAVTAADYIGNTNSYSFVRDIDVLDAPAIDLKNTPSRTNVVVTFTMPEGGNAIWYTYAVTNEDETVELVDPVGEEYDAASAAHRASKLWTNGSETVNIAIKAHQQLVVKAIAYFEEDDGVAACKTRCFTGKSAVTNATLTLDWTLADGLDDPDRTFTSTSSQREGSEAQVVEDDEIKNFGDSSVRFEGVADNQWLSVETTVVGPGTVVFDWKTICEKGPHDYNYDHMTFYVNGTPICKLDGDSGWQSVTNRINGDTFTKNVLKWVYEKDDSEHAQTEDKAWLDHFQWFEGKTQLEITEELDDWAFEYLDEDDYLALYNPDGSPNTTQWKQMLAQKAACNDRTYWECYVLGLDPTDEDAKFVITAPVLNEFIGTASVTFVPRMAGRTYTLVGKKALTDVYWADLAVIKAVETELEEPTTIKTEAGQIASEAHPEWAGYKYFTLRVKMTPKAK